jgi:hypothetical protein
MRVQMEREKWITMSTDGNQGMQYRVRSSYWCLPTKQYEVTIHSMQHDMRFQRVTSIVLSYGSVNIYCEWW